MGDAGHNNNSKLEKQECTKYAKRARVKMRETAPNIWSHKIPKFLKPSDAWDFLIFISVVDGLDTCMIFLIICLKPG
jgi:hypothetical protein